MRDHTGDTFACDLTQGSGQVQVLNLYAHTGNKKMLKLKAASPRIQIFPHIFGRSTARAPQTVPLNIKESLLPN